MDNLLDILEIPEMYRLNKKDLRSRIYADAASEIAGFVEEVRWVATYTPAASDVCAVRTDQARCDELEILTVKINDTSELFSVCKPIFKSIPYLCMLIVQYQSKCTLAACPFKPGKLDYDENILRKMAFSHWIYPDDLSKPAGRFLGTIRDLLSQGGNLQSLYSKIFDAILQFRIGGFTKKHVGDFVYDLTGKKEVSHLLNGCTPYKKHFPRNNSVAAKYTKRDRTSSFHYSFDTEDLWHSFRSNEAVRQVIDKRGYRDMDELIFNIEEKYARARERW